jgi:DNA-binding response OmpR family regulator
MRIFEAARADDGLALARKHRPDLIVLDLELASTHDGPRPNDFAALAHGGETPVVLLGSARRETAAPPRQFVAKPYHYQPLILKIEQLLRAGREPAQCTPHAPREETSSRGA